MTGVPRVYEKMHGADLGHGPVGLAGEGGDCSGGP